MRAFAENPHPITPSGSPLSLDSFTYQGFSCPEAHGLMIRVRSSMRQLPSNTCYVESLGDYFCHPEIVFATSADACNHPLLRNTVSGQTE
jgi:hypothetical protein